MEREIFFIDIFMTNEYICSFFLIRCSTESTFPVYQGENFNLSFGNITE